MASPTERWLRGDLSNFEYLLLINAAAGGARPSVAWRRSL
jgi:hypothetical protein